MNRIPNTEKRPTEVPDVPDNPVHPPQPQEIPPMNEPNPDK